LGFSSLALPALQRCCNRVCLRGGRIRHRGFTPITSIQIIPILSPSPPKSPLVPFLTRGRGDLLAVVASVTVKRHARVSLFICNAQDNALNKETAHLSGYCPIRKISVERRGTRVKRFFVSEAQRAELENLSEYRRSGATGDIPGASFWYFLREKVLRVLKRS
jgi:hypothetical protein